MTVPDQRQVGGGPAIYCAWCHLPASYVWTNRAPGLIDPNTDINPNWPIEVDPETSTCWTCEELIVAGHLVEMMDRGLNEWIRQLGGEPQRKGWREQAWATQSARVAAWLAHRDTRRDVVWEDVPPHSDDDEPRGPGRTSRQW